MHLEYRYGYHFIAYGRLSQKNFFGGFKGEPRKTVHMLRMGAPRNRFFQFDWEEMLKPQQTIYI